MSSLLAVIGRTCARFRWIVIGAWIILITLLIGFLALSSSGTESESSTSSLPDTPAAAALERMSAEFPSSGTASSLQLVFHPSNQDVTDPETTHAIETVLADAQKLPGVQAVSNPLTSDQPYISADHTLAVATLTYDTADDDTAQADMDAALAFQQQAPASLGVELGGNLLDMQAPPPGPGEGIGVLVAFVVLAITFGSILAAGANLLIAIIGVVIGVIGIFATGADSNSLILAAMLGLAVGIDYSLLILNRYKTELQNGRSVLDAIAHAIGTAGTAVVFAGATVIVALCALAVTGISFITEMGLAAAFTVAVAVLLALTLLPALMSFLGTRILSRRHRTALANGEPLVSTSKRRGVTTRWGAFVVKHPLLSLVSGAGILLVIAFPMLSMKTAFSIPGGSDPQATERIAYNEIVDGFGGVQSPLIVLAEGDNIAEHTNQIEQHLSTLDGVRQVNTAEINDAGDYARITVIPDNGPIDESTSTLVHEIRDSADDISGAHLEVTGESAIGIDQTEQLSQALITYVIVIVAISLILLTVLFRSVLIPIIATAGYLLSVGASFGASVAVFQWGWLDPIIAAPQGDPMLAMLPIVLVGVLFGLAMDYQVFLVSRIQEMHHTGREPKQAIREGFTRSAPVLIAAALIMAFVFAGFASSPFAVGAAIAFGLLVGVAADAFIVRLVLTPAVLSLLGDAAWWMPRWLDRILPNVDVEGSSLDDHATEQTPTMAMARA